MKVSVAQIQQLDADVRQVGLFCSTVVETVKSDRMVTKQTFTDDQLFYLTAALSRLEHFARMMQGVEVKVVAQ